VVRIALIAVLLPACAASMLVGATTVTAAAAGTSAIQRKAGGCYAICTAGTACNTNTGLCERQPCDGRCGPDQHCESSSFAESKCVAGAPSDVVSSAPGSQKTIPVLQPVPMPSGPPQIVPAAEQNPPSHK
jgi:hypothetical protein